MVKDPPPQPSPRWVLQFYLLVMLLAFLSPFVIAYYRKSQNLQNEKLVIEKMRHYAEAQEAYFKEHNEYAQSFEALGGDWAATPVMPSPFQTAGKGPSADALADFHGYQFRILTAQGASAEGGAKSWLDDKNRLTLGYGLLAAPVKYGFTGNYTFLMSGRSLYFVDYQVKTEQYVHSDTEFIIPPKATLLKP